jgi:hypothetical protein
MLPCRRINGRSVQRNLQCSKKILRFFAVVPKKKKFRVFLLRFPSLPPFFQIYRTSHEEIVCNQKHRQQKGIKGTVGPDWISLDRLKKVISRYRFFIFIFSFEYLKRLLSSEPLHKKMPLILL